MNFFTVPSIYLLLYFYLTKVIGVAQLSTLAIIKSVSASTYEKVKYTRSPRCQGASAEEVILSEFAAASGINANTARKERAKKANRIFPS